MRVQDADAAIDRAIVDELRRLHDVVWRMYCAGAMLEDVQRWRPGLSVDEVHGILLDRHEWLATLRPWYLLEPCCWCGDATCSDWGARPVAGRGWECFGCGLVRWLKLHRETKA